MTSLFYRRLSHVVHVGDVAIGGDNPIVIQSMTNTPTADTGATLLQIKALAAAGCQLVRVAVPDMEAAESLPALIKRSPLPLIADIHFDHRLALAAIRGGIHGLRLNPGNIGSQIRVKEVVAAAKMENISIRIGVNGGSLEKDLLARYGGPTAEALVESALRHVALLEEESFSNIKISLKSSRLPLMVQAYRLIAKKIDYPLHIGLTEAGSFERGSIRSAAALSILLSEGIGDTLRISLTGDPVREIFVAKELLKALELRQEGYTFISCPTCGRCQIDVESISRQVEEHFAGITPTRPLRLAIMGCTVNGPGEAREADLGIAGGKGQGLLFCRGEIVGKYPNHQLAHALIEAAEELGVRSY
ncbi:MAG: flavodoxin-dependent (E)-4-hydroxy-3-methylbut-2-enyl-diphosphate synthase [Clostridiales bacterium]|nr:flavodoxin-dependent (E)-4-hydroxy-3-methylbut-2-enyl-diphosphate synthase [Clostridiales bacterium]